jgi:hypothetical protein
LISIDHYDSNQERKKENKKKKKLSQQIHHLIHVCRHLFNSYRTETEKRSKVYEKQRKER